MKFVRGYKIIKGEERGPERASFSFEETIQKDTEYDGSE